ncbi:MAG: HEPN domain-containing protein [Thermodesulfobacteriota bacterium]
MGKKPLEWFKQADYDIKTAEIMFDNRRYIYAVFMCHLAIEKALKGLYTQKLNEIPPKTHNLIFLVEKIKFNLSEEQYDFISTLNGVSIPTRYPDDLQRMQKDYTKGKARLLLEKSKGALKWLRAELQR